MLEDLRGRFGNVQNEYAEEKLKTEQFFFETGLLLLLLATIGYYYC